MRQAPEMRIAHAIFLVFLLVNLPFSVWAQGRDLIGVSAPLSGPAAAWGIDLKNVLIFANEKLTGGKYEFVFEDDKCSPKEAVTIASKFTGTEGMKSVFIVCGAATIAAAPVYDRAHVLLMAPLATPSSISSAGLYVFRTGLNDAVAAAVLARRIGAKFRNVGVLTEQNDYSVGFLSDFTKAAAASGMEVHNEDFQSSDTDFRGQLLRIRGRHPEALFINSNTERLFALVLRQAKEMKLESAVFGAYLPGSDTFLGMAGDDAEGITFVDFPSAEMLTDEGRELYREFVLRYGRLKSWEFAFPAAFEAFRAVHAAMSGSVSPLDFLGSHKFHGIIGEYAFDSNGDITGVLPVIRTIRDGRTHLSE